MFNECRFKIYKNIKVFYFKKKLYKKTYASAKQRLKICVFSLYKLCYNHTRLKLTGWVKHKGCIVSSMRRRVKHQLNHENVKLTLSRLSQLFKGQLLFYIERIVFLMETIMFNSIQVINYWFILHRTLRLLYQQAQTFSPNIQGISDQDITL